MFNNYLCCIYSWSNRQWWDKSTGQTSKHRAAKNSRRNATAETYHSTIVYWLFETEWSFTNQHWSSSVYIC